MEMTITPKTVSEIVNSGKKIAFCITGGGMSAIGQLTEWGGASQCLLFAYTPYSKQCIDSYLKTYLPDRGGIEKYGSLDTAWRLAFATRCKAIVETLYVDTICVGVSSVLGYRGQREGRLNHACIYISDGEHEKKLDYDVSGYNTRFLQEQQVARKILQMIHEFIYEN
jgi:nicotinamide mononucleotide (NMN) deamidase PncC